MSALVVLALASSPAHADDVKTTKMVKSECLDLLARGEWDPEMCGTPLSVELGESYAEFCATRRTQTCTTKGFGTEPTDGHEIEPRHPGMYVELIEGWAVGVGGALPGGFIAVDRDPDVVQHALESGHMGDLDAGLQLTNSLETEGVALNVVDEGIYGEFLVAVDRSNEAAGAFRMDMKGGNLCTLDNLPVDIRTELGQLP